MLGSFAACARWSSQVQEPGHAPLQVGLPPGRWLATGRSPLLGIGACQVAYNVQASGRAGMPAGAAAQRTAIGVRQRDRAQRSWAGWSGGASKFDPGCGWLPG
jgi:hypothetical protein